MALNIRPLSKELQQVAYDELNEVPERLAEDITAIRLWMSQNTNLKSRTDDQFIVSFLRGCKFSLEKAKKKIEMFYRARTETPEFFANRDVNDKKLQEIMDNGFILPLPVDESKIEPRVILTRLGHYDTNRFSFLEIMKVSYLMGDITLRDSDVTVIAGHVNVVDLRNCGLNLMSQITPTVIKKLSSLLEPFPIRIKAIHLVYPPRAIDTAFRVLNSVAHEKVRNRIYVHDNFEQLFEKHPGLKHHLPSELGGTNSNLPTIISNWKKTLIAHHQWFIDDSQYRYNGINENQVQNGMFGAQGSFRSLDFD
ncbi:hypothetical protein PVAND_003285 [Polypedilum vanderplanki]|uniref:CRAL-TRIO domain-containing protein n=1 Tax=Polypedilum vanderplanki TaxID=319348 RepID=A0A9J6BUK7_POLVA|nr:hypothetical protein PVAND_003285 [Polypedilum vanderplanki]